MVRVLSGGLLLFTVAAAAQSAPVERSADVAAIRAVETRQAEAWNRHDAKAYAALFTDDGDCVNVVGWWWKGRAQIEQKLTAGYAYVFRDSTLTITQTDVKFLSNEVAIAHVRWTMTGAHTPPSIPEPRMGIQTQVLQKRGDHWLIGAFQNTNGVPETPFPSGPPGGH